MLEITKDNFEAEVQNAQKPVLIDFWATWCGPCKMIAPEIEKIANQYADQLTVGKVNVDEQPELAQRFSVQSIPTVMLFNGGSRVTEFVGYRKADELSALIDNAL